MMKCIKELTKIDSTQLEDQDLLMIFDISDHNKRWDLIERYGATKNLPDSTKCISIGELKKYLLNISSKDKSNVNWSKIMF